MKLAAENPHPLQRAQRMEHPAGDELTRLYFSFLFLICEKSGRVRGFSLNLS
jgi:hypothetical protein